MRGLEDAGKDAKAAFGVTRNAFKDGNSLFENSDLLFLHLCWKCISFALWMFRDSNCIFILYCYAIRAKHRSWRVLCLNVGAIMMPKRNVFSMRSSKGNGNESLATLNNAHRYNGRAKTHLARFQYTDIEPQVRNTIDTNVLGYK